MFMAPKIPEPKETEHWPVKLVSMKKRFSKNGLSRGS